MREHTVTTGKFVYHFTSETQAKNFKRDRDEYREMLENSLSNRFKMSIAVSQDFADLVLYHRTSNRVFLVEYAERTYTNMQDVIASIGVQNI